MSIWYNYDDRKFALPTIVFCVSANNIIYCLLYIVRSSNDVMVDDKLFACGGKGLGFDNQSGRYDLKD